MPVEIRDPRMVELADEHAELEQLASGMVFTEGPIWVPDGQYLLFSDVPANRRYRWDEANGVRPIAAPTGHANGMTLDGDGRLIVCEGGARRLARMDAAGTGEGIEALVSTYEQRSLNSPNDVVVHSNGSIYFTDPWWLPMIGVEAERELEFAGVFRLATGGALTLLGTGWDFPNGLCFSPDESTLYVNDAFVGKIHAFDVRADGSIANRRTVADDMADEQGEIDGGHPDGMKCDVEGNIWVTGPGGVWVLDAGGTTLGVIPTPARVGNLHWGGPDWSWLFVAATSGVYRLRTKTAGSREPFMQ